jgi:hypothetical protein
MPTYFQTMQGTELHCRDTEIAGVDATPMKYPTELSRYHRNSISAADSALLQKPRKLTRREGGRLIIRKSSPNNTVPSSGL